MMDMYGFYTGQIFNAYDYLGAHFSPSGTIFRTFAPCASSVTLLYKGQEIFMKPIYDGNFYEVTINNGKLGDLYEYRIYQQNGDYTDHCDPYGFEMELPPKHKSMVCDLTNYIFHDNKWMKQRTNHMDGPLNIYELHIGSWLRKGDDEWYLYHELAQPLAQYLKKSGYNYVEFLPINEHPCYESWGYQNTGFYSPTKRYGLPAELKQLIDILHQNGIGVILDFVPVHFAIDKFALAQYDGSALYEYPSKDIGTSEWGSYNFMHSRGEVRSFLQSAANFWLKEYHFDGLRMDAISHIIYWQGDEKRGKNGNAIDFIKVMNQGLKRINSGCILIAEDSSDYPGVTQAVAQGGLGFDYKWDMGWMHDTLEYFQCSPEERSVQYHKLTFSMMYFQNEKYLLPFSHDEVVHGKATILQKMNGEYKQKFPQARAMYLYMMVHPGKKLNFMGNEIGQLREWDEKCEQDWSLRKFPIHDSFYHYISELNRIYLMHTALYEWDYKEAGFEWLDCHQEKRCIYTITRKSDSENLCAIFNFSSHIQEKYTIEIPEITNILFLLNSDWEQFGGKTPSTEKIYELNASNLICTLQPFSAILFEITTAGEIHKHKILEKLPE